jgi:hypothetical protein
VLSAHSGCRNLNEYDRERVKSVSADSLIKYTEAWQNSIVLIEKGIKRFNLKSEYSRSQDTDSGSVTFASGNVFVEVFDSVGTISRTVECQELTYFGRTSQMELKHHVRVVTNDERRLFADDLLWMESNGKIFSDGFVIILTPSDSIAGIGLVSTDDLSQYTIKNVTGTVTVDRENEDPS